MVGFIWREIVFHMPRANRISCKGVVWHITHRCHERSFLLKFSKDRRRWRHWLFEAKRRYGLSVLNYIATSNHVHLLVADQGNGEIPASMQLVAGRTAQEFNKRKDRRGAFWQDRYHATAVQSDEHLAACITYINLNMVRAGAVDHPNQWDVTGYTEIQSAQTRRRVIDVATLCRLRNVASVECLAKEQREAIENSPLHDARQAAWTEAVGVGDEGFLRELKSELGPRGFRRKVTVDGPVHVLRDTAGCYFTEIPAKNDF